MRLSIFIAASVFAAATLSAHADTLVGSQVNVQYLFPATNVVYDDFGTQTVTSGLTDTNKDGNSSLTFGADTITVTNLAPGQFAVDPFNGFDVSFLSGPTIENVTIDPSSSSLFTPGSVLNFTGSSISLNIAGTCSTCSGGESIILDVTTTSATPEPSSIALLGTGLLGLAGTLRKRLA